MSTREMTYTVTGTVLILDRNMVSVNVLSEITLELGLEAKWSVTTGKEALEILKGEKPDFIIVNEVINGDASSIDIIEEINKEYKIPIVYLTEAPESEIIERLQGFDKVQVLIKPYSSYELQYYLYYLKKHVRGNGDH